MRYLGDFAAGVTVAFTWDTNDASGASITRATNGTVQVYKDNGVAQSVAGVTDTEDFDSLTGVHACEIDTSADGAFYAAGSDFAVVLAGAVIDGETVNAVLAHFSIGNRSAGGHWVEDSTHYFLWNTHDASGASATRTVDGTVQVYAEDDDTQSVAGITDTEDFDSLTGVHLCTIDTSADAFYAAGKCYSVVLAAATIDGQTVNATIGEFALEAAATTPTGTDATGVTVPDRGILQPSWGAGSDATGGYCVFAKLGGAPTLLTLGSAEHILTAPAGTTTIRIVSGLTTAALFTEGTWYFIVKGINLASGNLDANTTAVSVAVLPLGVVGFPTSIAISGNVPVQGVAGGEPIDTEVSGFTPTLTIADLLACTATLTIADILAHTAEVPVKGVVGGEPLDVESTLGVPVQGIGGGTPVDIAASLGLQVNDILAITGKATVADVEKVFGLTTLTISVAALVTNALNKIYDALGRAKLK